MFYYSLMLFMTVKLNIQNLTKIYNGSLKALDSISLNIEPGVLGLLGPNGAGKSTLMRIIATISKQNSGEILWNDIDIAKEPDEIRKILGYLPQNFGVYGNLTSVEFLQYIGALKGINKSSLSGRIEEILQYLNLYDVRKRPLSSYSGGMRQRIGIAQALLNDPQLLIVDEPTVGLDPEERVRFRNLIGDLAGDRIVILSTHIVSDVEASATKIAIVNKGKLLKFTEPEVLLQQLHGKVWSFIVQSKDLLEARKKFLISGTMRNQAGVLLRVISDTSPNPDAEIITPNLEDAYLYYISTK